VRGQALAARGIRDGDILVADAAAEPRPGGVCVAMVGGDVILAPLARRDALWVLEPSSGPIVHVEGDVEVWAIVESLVRQAQSLKSAAVAGALGWWLEGCD
jgi:DNA polymerase V